LDKAMARSELRGVRRSELREVRRLYRDVVDVTPRAHEAEVMSEAERIAHVARLTDALQPVAGRAARQRRSDATGTFGRKPEDMPRGRRVAGRPVGAGRPFSASDFARMAASRIATLCPELAALPEWQSARAADRLDVAKAWLDAKRAFGTDL
jgi:hypothetical protein